MTLSATGKKISFPLSKRFSFQSWGLLAILALSYFTVLGTGLATPVSLGDEVYHYRFAKSSYLLKARAAIDAHYAVADPAKIQLVTDPGWPMMLSYLWRLCGTISSQLAQVYHSLFFLLLVAGTFFLTSALYGRETALWSALLAATMPMLVSFGILFYTDVPATALITAIFFLCCRRSFLPAGVLLAVAYLVKKGTVFFLPALLLLAVYFHWQEKKKILPAIFALLIPVTIVTGIEMAWQVQHIPSGRSTLSELRARLGVLYQGKVSTATETAAVPSLRRSWLDIVKTLLQTEYSNSHILKLQDNAKYWGLAMPFLLAVSFVKTGFKNPAWILLMPVLICAACILFLCLLPDIRYWMPAAPFLCILAARAVPQIKSLFIRGIIIALCLAQLFASSYYVFQARSLPKAYQESLGYIRTNTPENTLFLNPDLLVLEYADRRIVWGLCDVRRILWGTENERRAELKRVGIDYVAVNKSRIYDDRNMTKRHIGGYPLSFLEILKKETLFSPIFENEAMSLWKVDRSKL